MFGSKKPLALLVTVVALVGSACVPAFTPSSPSISGDAVVGGTVQVSTEWSVQPSETMYSWFACEDNSQDSCSEIVSGMGQSSISLDASAEGKWVFATVRGTNVAGNAEASTDLLGPVAQASNDCTIAGTAVETVLSGDECDALVAIYDAVPEPGPAKYEGWNTATDPCGWANVECSGEQLRTLDLSYGQLVSVPAEIGNLTNLTWLRLDHNQLTAVPAELGNLTNLSVLDVGNNQLTSLPTEIGNLTNLTRLALSSNQLVSLPAEIGNLTNVTGLFVISNQLTSVPAAIGNLASLEYLYLASNQLASVPAEIGNLTNLIRLRLEGNQLGSLPAEIGNLTNLTRLQLHGNALTSLPVEIGNLANLDTLVAAVNQFGTVPAEIANLTNLTTLDLRETQLTSLPNEFGNLTNLENLDLRKNSLTGDLALPLGGLQSSVSVVRIKDGVNGNNCLTSTDPALKLILDEKDPGWDECAQQPA